MNFAVMIDSEHALGRILALASGQLGETLCTYVMQPRGICSSMLVSSGSRAANAY